MTTRAIAAALVLALLLPTTVPAEPPSSAPRTWSVKYVEGEAKWKLDTRLTVSLGEEILLREPRAGGATLSVPARSIHGVLYDSRVWHGSSAVWKVVEWSAEPDNWNGDYLSGLVMFTTLFGSLAILPVAHAIQGKKHFVHLLWRDGAAEKMVVLQLDAKDYAAFLAELERLTGAPWVDLPRQREQLRRDLEREKRNALTIELDRMVRLGQDELLPGRYRMVVVPRTPGRAEVYFFLGPIRHDKVLAAASAEVVPGPTGRDGVEVFYRRRPKGLAPTLALVVTSNQTLRFLAQPAVAASTLP